MNIPKPLRAHPEQPQADTAEGHRRKRIVLAELRHRRSTLVRKACRLLIERLLAGAPDATADNIRDGLEVPPGIDPRCLGAVPVRLYQAGIIHTVGYRRSRRRDAHARPLNVWRLTDRAAAIEWLRKHPPLTDADDAKAAGGDCQ